MAMYLSALVFQTIFESSATEGTAALVPKTFAQISFMAISYFLVTFLATYVATRISFGSFYLLAAIIFLILGYFSLTGMLDFNFGVGIIITVLLSSALGCFLAARTNLNIKKRIQQSNDRSTSSYK
jgi:hypothetical protein